MGEESEGDREADFTEPVITVTDARRVMAYLLVPESDDYIAIMEVLESSVTDMSPAEVTSALRTNGHRPDQRTVETRLRKLQSWHAVTARPDVSQVRRYSDLLAGNWRYTATPTGRQVQRFYTQVLSGAATMREIPLPSLARVVESLEALVRLLTRPDDGAPGSTAEVTEHIGRVFTSHDDLDSALVGAEDRLAELADRFDLGAETTNELKRLLVDYATHVAADFDQGSARAHNALTSLTPHFDALVHAATAESQARALIERGVLAASRGGRPDDWAGLLKWFDPATGRAARFGLRLVRALPGMHANLRRLNSSTESVTTRARALAFARACLHPEHGGAVWLAALGDHSWRKLAGVSDEEETAKGGTPWRDGPGVEIPELLRTTGRTGARGRAAAARDDTAARATLTERRRERMAAHLAAVREVLAAPPGAPLSEAAARVALGSLNLAARGARRRPTTAVPFVHRTAAKDGLACTVLYTGEATGAETLRAPSWRVLAPGRVAVFHRPGTAPEIPARLLPANGREDDPEHAEGAA
ncbi:DUF2397 family protein [Actinomadura rupiterrae]|uniref:DUF2397 family protein n=1 Tax=Actinomadura rupiterrae TaxID=559627 RepID=UPI0020A61957|nr:DUF2397 family protein [Actinomadura rupiterrae]MCP2342992.1 uncharacterized protein (TIGR02677 family) [Actinomadura rupiterrae]